MRREETLRRHPAWLRNSSRRLPGTPRSSRQVTTRCAPYPRCGVDAAVVDTHCRQSGPGGGSALQGCGGRFASGCHPFLQSVFGSVFKFAFEIVPSPQRRSAHAAVELMFAVQPVDEQGGLLTPRNKRFEAWSGSRRLCRKSRPTEAWLKALRPRQEPREFDHSGELLRVVRIACSDHSS